MDSEKLVIFKVDVEAQLNLIKKVDERLKERANNLKSDDLILLESIAYQIHNLYSAIEDLLKLIADYFENNISHSSQWHRLLLQRMTIIVPEVRPAVLSSETYTLLNALRGFRHFFRHAYGATIEYEQLKSNLDKALNVFPKLKSDLNQFLAQLEQSNEESEEISG
jgi:uncharacterized protein YutE (UPF0331/DUF86 family)